MISFSKFIGFLNFKVNAYTFLLISFSTDWNGKSLLRLYLLVKGRKSQKPMCCDSNSTKNKMPASAITHSRFGHYFYSNLYGRAPQGSQGCQKIGIIFLQIKLLSSCAKIAPKRHKLRKIIKIEKTLLVYRASK